jgi:hypothetical protein
MALSISATYNDDFGRVQISFTGANTDADYAKVEHSYDQITWSTIRGGDTVPLSGGAGHVDHYDGYTFGIPNYYRVTAIDSSPIQATAAGAFTTGNNTTLAPPLPAGLLAGNIMILTATHQNTAATVTTPTGWTRLTGGDNHMVTFWRAYQSGDTAPSVAFSGGAAGQSCSATIRGFTNAQAPLHASFQSNVSAQDVAYPSASQPTLSGLVWLLHEWKQATGTGASLPVSFFADPWGGFNTAGASAESQILWRTLSTDNVKTINALSNAWQGGTAAISKARLMYLAPRAFTDQATATYTPVFPSGNTKPYWLMNPARPGQNIRVEITSFSEISQAGRTGIFEIVGRSAPVIVSDIMESGSFEFTIDAATKAEAKEIAARVALGDPMYLLVPDPNADIDTFYFTATSLKRAVDAPGGSWSVTVSAREVSQPAPAVYGSTYIWDDVVTDYASWTAVLADLQNTTWANLVDRISDDVIIVP